MSSQRLLGFGPFALDASQRVLRRGDEPLRLTPREIDVLVTLVEHHGEIVEKSRFFDEVWRGLAVEDCNLSQHVASLRRVLGDDARVPTYIETLPRRGYRFVAPVATLDRASPAPGPAAAPIAATSPSAPTVAPPGGAPAVEAIASVAPVAPESPAAAARDAATTGPATEPAALVSATSRRAASWSARARSTGPGELLRAARWLAPASLGALVALGVALGWRLAHARSPATPLARAVVVQPFANLTGDAHHDAIAATLTAELMRDLGGAAGLRIVTGSLPATERQAAGADAIVEAALLSADGKMRLTVELIDAATRRLRWAEVFESAPVSFLETEDRIASAIVERLADRDPDAERSPDRAAAQRECVLARDYLSRRSPHVVREALAHFTAAAARDGAYAPAHAGVAEAYLLGAEQRVLAPGDALAGAEAAARRALELDPRLAEAHAALGEVAAARWDFDAAEASYRRALELDPAIATVHVRYAGLLTLRDRHDEAVAQARVARDLAPGSPAAVTALAAAYYHSGQSDAAIDEALVALRLAPRFAAAYDVLGWAYQAKGRNAEAVAAFREAVRLSAGCTTYVAALARAHARAGGREEARRLLSDLERRHPDRAASRLDLAAILAALGETDRALRQVERAEAEGAPWLPHVDAGLSLAALHDREQFRALVARMRRSAAADRDDGRSPAAAPRPAGTSGAVPLSMTAPLGATRP